jgi:inorganic pyrophosphatase
MYFYLIKFLLFASTTGKKCFLKLIKNTFRQFKNLKKKKSKIIKNKVLQVYNNSSFIA